MRSRITRLLFTITVATAMGQAAVNVGSSSWVWQNPVPQGNNLNVVSCPATNICYAVGDLGTILYFNGTNWSAQFATVAFNLNSISCPGTTICFAAGDFGTIVATNNSGASWSQQNSGTFGNLTGISCPTTSDCFAVGAGGVIYTTLGISPTTWSPLLGNGSALSCPTTIECYIVNGASVNRLLLMNGLWELLPSNPIPAVNGLLAAISCVSESTCAATAGGFVIGTADFGNSWSSAEVGSNISLNSISCMNSLTLLGPSPFCFAVGADSAGSSVVSTGAITSFTWYSVPAPAGVDVPFRAVSCQPVKSGTPPIILTVGLCHAVGDRGALAANDTSDAWSSQEALLLSYGSSNAQRLFGASCPAVGTCFVVRGTTLSTSTNGDPWTTRAQLPSYGTAISCPNTLDCFITTNGAVAVTTDGGTTFQLHYLPAGFIDLLEGISCPSTQICFAAGKNLWGSTDGGLTWIDQQGFGILPAGGISCPSAKSCVAVGHSGAIDFTFDGQHWNLSNSGSSVFLRAISCATTTNCFAAGDYGTILAGTFIPATGTWSWTPQASPTYHNNILHYESISCLPASGLSSFSCEAGGFDAAGDGVIVTGPGTWIVEAALDSDIRALSCTGSVGGFLQNSNFECVAGGESGTILTKRIVSLRVLGTGDLTPSDGTSAVGEPTTFSLTWTVPSPQVWRDLKYLDIRLADDTGIGLWARFIPGNPSALALLDGNGNIVSEGVPGAAGILDSPTATLDLAHSSFQAAGPTSPTVTVNFAVALKPSAAPGPGARVYDTQILITKVSGENSAPDHVGHWAVRPSH